MVVGKSRAASGRRRSERVLAKMDLGGLGGLLKPSAFLGVEMTYESLRFFLPKWVFLFLTS